MQKLLTIASWIDRLNERVGRLACWLTLLMILIGSFNAIARYVGRYWGISLTSNAFLEMQWYLFSAVFLLGAAYTLRHNAHVRVDVLFSRLCPRTQAWIELIGTLAFLVPFCIIMLWVSWAPVRNSWMILEMSPDPGGLPRYPIKSLIPLAFFLLLLQGIADGIKQWGLLKGVIRTSLDEYHPGDT